MEMCPKGRKHCARLSVPMSALGHSQDAEKAGQPLPGAFNTTPGRPKIEC
jgi:hypothetical protein